jgi:2-keto-4-pentenoate hydratase
MAEARLTQIAQLLADARRAGQRISLADPPRDFDEGFAVQDEVVRLLGQPIMGWKVIEMPNGGPVLSAPLLADGKVPAGGTWKVVGPEPAGLELEIAFIMARDVPATASTSEILDCIGSANVVFELCQSRNEKPETLPRHVGLADCILNAGVAVGASFAGWRERDLKGITGRLKVDGKVLKEGESVDPIRAISVLAPALVKRGRGLKAGDVVITGSLIGMNWITGKHALRGEIDGCGHVEIGLDAA